MCIKSSVYDHTGNDNRCVNEYEAGTIVIVKTTNDTIFSDICYDNMKKTKNTTLPDQLQNQISKS